MKKHFQTWQNFIFSFLRNIFSLYLTPVRINVRLAVIIGENHLATWEFWGSNESRMKLICLPCEQLCAGEQAIPLENTE